MNPIIHVSQNPLSPDDLDQLPRQRYRFDWPDKPIDFVAEFVLAFDGRQLHQKAWCSLEPDCDFTIPCGEFRAELWKRDVAELFLLDPKTGFYQEWNLSPVGAWWTHKYKVERQLDPNYIEDRNTVETRGDAAEGRAGWSAQISIDRREFGELSELRVNVPMIAQQHFLSCCPEDKPEPDFHNLHNYPTPVLKCID